MLEPSWLSIARAELGVKEVPGKPANDLILRYWKEVGLSAVAGESDEVAWCAAFAGFCLSRAKLSHTGKANARSYESYGRALRTPCLGAIVVLSRPPSAWQGHVGFYLGTDKEKRRIRLLGGNQGDAVTIADFSLDRVVAYRWPSDQPIHADWVGAIPFKAGAQAEVKTA